MKHIGYAALAACLLSSAAVAATVDPYGIVELSAGTNCGVIFKNNTDAAGTVDIEYIAGDPLIGGGTVESPFLLMDGTLRVSASGIRAYRMLVKRAYVEPCRASRSQGRKELRERSLMVLRSARREKEYRKLRVLRAGGIREAPTLDELRTRRGKGRVGNYGVDVANNYVWAVVDVDGDFAVGGLVPEPVTVASLLGGLGCLVLTRRKS